MKTTTTTAAIAMFLNTWGNYNENGADGGHWVNLPCDLAAEYKKLAAATGERPEDMEPFINDYDSDINGLDINEYADINELNARAAELENTTKSQLRRTAAEFREQYRLLTAASDTTSTHVNEELRKIEVNLTQLPRALDQIGAQLQELEGVLKDQEK